ncbi:MAG: magnesium-translocating P-type ATPase [Lachnospiraceae bacterium]|nr:magnesium-translocating P-type ATPase [Lachnospiraceae bacterium]
MTPNHSIHERVSDYAQMDPEFIFLNLHMPETGLSDEDVGKSRKRYGENILIGQKKETTAHLLARSFFTPFSIVLLLLAVVSLFTDVILASNFSRNITTFIIIIVMLIVSGVIRFIQEIRARRVTEQLLRLVHTTVQVFRNGHWQELPSSELVVGDHVRLDAGDRVPADIRLTKAEDFFVSQSVITGESDAMEKTGETLSGQPVGVEDYTNTVFLGSTVIGGLAEGVVLAVGQDTLYGGFSLEENERKHGFDRGENAIAWVLIRFMVVLVPIVFVACGLTKNDWLAALIFALSVAIGLTPELLPMVITACLAKGSHQMGQKKTIVKTTNAMQGFGSMDILCVDKTGTLTSDRVILEYYMDVLGNESMDTLDAAYINSYYHTGVSNHLDKEILHAKKMPGQREHFDRLIGQSRQLDEVPFDYERMFASVLVQRDGENILMVKGNVDRVIDRCKYVVYQGEQHEIGEDGERSVHEIVDEMLEEGMKVLAVASKRIDKLTVVQEDEYDLTLMGFLAFFDAPKQSAASAIEKLQNLHVGIKVLTGDHEEVAISICRRLGIPTERVMTGVQLDALIENDVPVAVERTSIFAELSPQQKARVVEILQDNGHDVGFLGDGMNDLHAVGRADVGISVDTATDAVKENADVILLKKDLNVLDEGVLEGRKAFTNMKKYVRITASSNLGNILAIVVASVLLPFFPMTALQLLLLNLLYDILCLVLPWDNVDPELTERPLEWSGWSLGRFMLYFGIVSSVLDCLTFAFLYFYLCPAMCGGVFHALDALGQAQFIALFQTGWFLESLWTQILILHMLRTKRIPFTKSRPSNQVILVTVFGVILFTVLTFTPLGRWIGLTAMPALFFLFLVGIVGLYLLLVRMMKTLYIKRYRNLI